MVCLFFCGSALAQLQPRDLVAITGDSITEQRMYSVYIEDYLLMCQPQMQVRTMQFGWSGETSWGFLARVENDCLRFKPTIVTTCFGMNDGGYAPPDEARLKKYRDAMTGLVESFQKSGARVVLGSPGCVDSHTFRNDPRLAETYNQTLAAERDIVRDIAKEKNVGFADVYDAMHETMPLAKDKYGAQYHLAGADGVHPAANGHLVMAYAFLKALRCDGGIGTISVDLASNTATASDGHRVLSFEGGRLMIESTRYPFCFLSAANQSLSNPSNVRGVLPFVPFNRDLNRFVLIVANAPADKVKITWGDAGKQFSREELSRGINLADEFLDNPFADQFKMVDAAVREQQSFQTTMIKSLVHGVRYELPDEPKLLDDTVAATSKKDALLSRRATDLVVPVTHTIKIEPQMDMDERR